MKLSFSTFLISSMFLSTTAFGASSITGIRLADIAKFSKTKFPQAKLLESRMAKYPSFYYGTDEAKSHMNFIISAPEEIDTNHYKVVIGSVVDIAKGNTVNASQWGGSQTAKHDTADTDNDYEIHINTLEFKTNSNRVNFELIDKEVINISDTEFSAKIGLKNRRLILEDKNNSALKIVMPVGVGSLDLGVSQKGVYQLMTPLYESQDIDTDLDQVSWAHRDDISYYRGKPFIRFRTRNGQYNGWSTIGLHIKQNAVFKRGFDSHGCMRLREKDLNTTFHILTKTQNNYGLVPASIYLSLDSGELDHPMPKINNSIKIVKNAGTVDNPKTTKDRHNLTATEPMQVTTDEFEDIWSRIEESYNNGLIKTRY